MAHQGEEAPLPPTMPGLKTSGYRLQVDVQGEAARWGTAGFSHHTETAEFEFLRRLATSIENHGRERLLKGAFSAQMVDRVASNGMCKLHQESSNESTAKDNTLIDAIFCHRYC
jgi:hypothetical protein